MWARTQWVPEYGRDHTVLKHQAAVADAARRGRPAPPLEELAWDADDFGLIAERQTALEETAARAGSPVLVCDTDALATRVWERRYVGLESRAAAERTYRCLQPAQDLSAHRSRLACRSSKTDGATGSKYVRR